MLGRDRHWVLHRQADRAKGHLASVPNFHASLSMRRLTGVGGYISLVWRPPRASLEFKGSSGRPALAMERAMGVVKRSQTDLDHRLPSGMWLFRAFSRCGRDSEV